jgi:flagellar hook-associated protein 3 FlgL
MSNSLNRIGTANMYENALRHLSERHANLSGLQEQLTSGKRVNKPSDDPVAAAQAERAMTRIMRNDTDKRALEMQRNTMTLAESALGDAVSAMQSFRELVISAGNGAYTRTERNAIAQQMESLREQIMGYANSTDSDGTPLFQALGSAQSPFGGAAPAFNFAGLPGQLASGMNQIAKVLDGQAAWMSVPTGNGVFEVDLTPTNTGQSWADPGHVSNPSALTGHGYQINFSVIAGTTTYDVIDTTSATPVLTAQPYTSTGNISFDGMVLKVSGSPANGDSFGISPSQATNVFQVLEEAVDTVRNATLFDGSTATGPLTHGISRGLAEIDAALSRLQSSRSLAGDLLNRSDRIEGELATLNVQLETDRSRAEDLDMIKGISDFQNQQVGYEAALKSYAQVQQLSLFKFI